MTEDEAKTKWCPFVRITPSTEDHHSVTSRGEIITRDVNVSLLCIGSACMAWRARPMAGLHRAQAELAADRKINAIKALRESFPEYGLLEAKQVIEGERPWPVATDGYCGLAGAPQ